MWSSAFTGVSSAVSSAWQWFDSLFDAIPGAWEFLAFVILVFLICKHILAPLTGMAIYGGMSDRVRSARKERQKAKASKK